MQFPSPDILRNLVQIGFMASFHGEHQKANDIFSGLNQIRPEDIEISMGLAVTQISAGKTENAIRIIEQTILSRQPDHAVAQCFLSWAYQLTGNSEKAQVIASAIEEKANPEAVALLDSLQPESQTRPGFLS